MIHFPKRSPDQTIDCKTVDLDKEEFVCKIVDFGLARKIGSKKWKNSFVGTP